MKPEQERLIGEATLLLASVPKERRFEAANELFEDYVAAVREEWPDIPEERLESSVVELAREVRSRLDAMAMTSGGAAGTA